MNLSDHQPFVSVVLPVFNGGPFLRRCIESVLAQTYRNWDLTVIDNCSTDDSRAIAEEYASRDSRVKVITNEKHVPIIENHSRAMAALSRDAVYVKPLMADDWLYPECLAIMVQAALRHPRIGLVCCYAFDGVNVVWTGFPHPAEHVSGRAAARLALLQDRYFFGTPSSMLIRSDLVRCRQPFYNLDNWHADQESGFDLLRECDFAFVHQVLLFNRFHGESQTSRIEALDSVMVGCVYVVWKYGPHFLSAAELKGRWKTMFGWYYEMLKHAALKRRDARYWAFHRQKLSLMNLKLQRWRVALLIVWHVLQYMASPRDIFLNIRRRIAVRRKGFTSGTDGAWTVAGLYQACIQPPAAGEPPSTVAYRTDSTKCSARGEPG